MENKQDAAPAAEEQKDTTAAEQAKATDAAMDEVHHQSATAQSAATDEGGIPSEVNERRQPEAPSEVKALARYMQRTSEVGGAVAPTVEELKVLCKCLGYPWHEASNLPRRMGDADLKKIGLL